MYQLYWAHTIWVSQNYKEDVIEYAGNWPGKRISFSYDDWVTKTRQSINWRIGSIHDNENSLNATNTE